jgi:hypothetical protein
MPTIARRAVLPESHQGLMVHPAAGTRRRESARRTFDAPSAPPSPARELARRALDVLRRARPASAPEQWLRPGFGREVDLVRLHLTPVRSRAALASSFGREAFNVAADEPSTEEATSIGPVHVAYALRWLELGDGRRRASFVDWLADPAERTPQMNRSSTT